MVVWGELSPLFKRCLFSKLNFLARFQSGIAKACGAAHQYLVGITVITDALGSLVSSSLASCSEISAPSCIGISSSIHQQVSVKGMGKAGLQTQWRELLLPGSYI